jgi:hypothetical protein
LLFLGTAVTLGPIVGSSIWGIIRLIRHRAPGAPQDEIAARHDLISQQLKSSAVIGETTMPDRRWFYLSEDGHAEPTTAKVALPRRDLIAFGMPRSNRCGRVVSATSKTGWAKNVETD